MMQLKSLHSVLMGILSGGFCLTALAAYPDKPIRLIVPFPAGGATDLVSRAVAVEMSSQLGQQVVVENKAGAGSVIGTELASTARADGYTLLMAGSTNIYMPYVYKKLAFKPIEAFTGIGLVADIPNVFAVNAASSFRSVADVLSAAREKPGSIAYASAGVATPSHLVCEFMAHSARVTLNHVPYKGNAPAVNDLMGGQVPSMCNNLAGTVPYLKSGKIRILAVTGKSRSPTVPDVPTFEESGIRGLDSGLWLALVAPNGVPQEVVSRLSTALANALETPSVRERMGSLGAVPLTARPDAYEARIRQEIKAWDPVLRQLNLSVE